MAIINNIAHQNDIYSLTFLLGVVTATSFAVAAEEEHDFFVEGSAVLDAEPAEILLELVDLTYDFLGETVGLEA